MNSSKQTREKKIEASEATLSRNRILPACYRSNGIYNVAEEEGVEEEEDIDGKEE